MAEGLKKKLGPVLFQLPSKAAYTEGLLQRLLDSLDPAFQNVIEFCHPSWWDGEVQRRLARHRIAFVGQSYPPPLELPDEVMANTDVVYYRFHTVPELYKSSYSPDFPARIAAEIKAAKNMREVYTSISTMASGPWAWETPGRCRLFSPDCPLEPGLAAAESPPAHVVYLINFRRYTCPSAVTCK
ncbi:DUF72 domain-containing protein [Microvirga sp. STS02]|uniref:DUF72 domain-containing protein n=1 Tax=Hymenobacter negativus TaxID=2795026 RepID=UPI0018DD5CC1|nr:MULTISPECIES: DUF72 domain-containing protein [Bacteria]MBH8568130.1 DUF72 domain-containing protein [Hymenobacter negativus]MBR7207865.1 DUF72 domain-containing protein [Microvirga sp. STS02]